jgi:hypothetical protein
MTLATDSLPAEIERLKMMIAKLRRTQFSRKRPNYTTLQLKP